MVQSFSSLSKARFKLMLHSRRQDKQLTRGRRGSFCVLMTRKGILMVTVEHILVHCVKGAPLPPRKAGPSSSKE